MLQEFLPDNPLATQKLGAGLPITYICSDAIGYYREVKSRGFEADKPFVGNSMWVTGVTDPDGYRLYFESPTDAPEESEYSDS